MTAGWLVDRGIALPYLAGAALVLLAVWSVSGVAIAATVEAPTAQAVSSESFCG